MSAVAEAQGAAAAVAATTTPDGKSKGVRSTILPTTFSLSWSEWWARSSLSGQESERRILSKMSFFPEPSTTHRSAISIKPLSGKNRAINTFEVEPVDSMGKEKVLVMLHGYGAGLGLFFSNYERLGTAPGYKLFSLDLLGMGRSSRPHFHVRSKAPVEERVHQAEAFFLDALEEWRERQGIEKFTLCAHSLGGYLATVYAMEHPERVEQLILVSPVGVPENPNLPQDSEPETNVEEEILQPQTETTGRVTPGTSTPETLSSGASTPVSGSSTPTSKVDPQSANHRIREALKNKPQVQGGNIRRRRLGSVITYLWEKNVTPFGIVRAAGPFGPMLVTQYTARRFAAMNDEDKKTLHDYLYCITTEKGSGEFALSHLLAPGAYARIPLIRRIDKLKVPTTFIYGDRDWMDSAGGQLAVDEMRRNKVPCDLKVISSAGHHVYLDNPSGFDEYVLKVLEGQAGATS